MKKSLETYDFEGAPIRRKFKYYFAIYDCQIRDYADVTVDPPHHFVARRSLHEILHVDRKDGVLTITTFVRGLVLPRLRCSAGSS